MFLQRVKFQLLCLVCQLHRDWKPASLSAQRQGKKKEEKREAEERCGSLGMIALQCYIKQVRPNPIVYNGLPP